MNNMPEERRKKLKKLLKEKEYIRVMEASNGLTGLIVENTKVENKEYDAMWISSLCDSTLKGKEDNEVVDFSSRVNTIEEIMEVTSKPIIVDGDTGGKIEHFVQHIKTLERIGVSAIIIEDKKGLKQNSLYGNKVEQQLEEKEIFAEKIRQGKRVIQTADFMIFARIESFIADMGIDDAMQRAEEYINHEMVMKDILGKKIYFYPIFHNEYLSIIDLYTMKKVYCVKYKENNCEEQ